MASAGGMCLVIYAYGDDGSDEKQKRVTAVSIIAGYEDWWQELEDQWIVRCGGIPFHATDCESDHGSYRGISHNQNKAMYADLTGILAASKVGGIGIGIDLTAQNKIFPNALPMAYHRAFIECLERVANVAEKEGEVCEITYDISKENEANAATLYAWMREGDERLCRLLHKKISFASWRESPRLQAADLLAFEAWKAIDHTVGTVKRKRKSWELLRATDRFETFAYSDDWFRDLKKHLESGELGKWAGFNESDYNGWLKRHNRQHSLSHLFQFLRSTSAPDEEFKNFDKMARELLKVPHAEIQAKLDAEKAAKKRKKSKKSSSSGHA